MVDFLSICMNWSMELIEGFVDLKLYRSPPDTVNCLVEEGGTKSGSGDQGISHNLKLNL